MRNEEIARIAKELEDLLTGENDETRESKYEQVKRQERAREGIRIPLDVPDQEDSWEDLLEEFEDIWEEP